MWRREETNHSALDWNSHTLNGRCLVRRDSQQCIQGHIFSMVFPPVFCIALNDCGLHMFLWVPEDPEDAGDPGVCWKDRVALSS